MHVCIGIGLKGNNKEELERHLAKQIGKSGFPLEIKSSLILRKFGWKVVPHVIFFDTKFGKYKEIDITAFKTISDPKSRHPILVNMLVLECKKQEKNPWVFFEQEKPNTNFTSVCLYPNEGYSWLEGKFENHYYYNQKPCAFHFPSFVEKMRARGKRSPDVILEAINQVVDSLLYTFDSCQHALPKNIPVYWFFYPVIILDGLLFSAVVETNGKIRLNEAEYLQLSVRRGLMKPEKIQLSKRRLLETLTKDIMIDIVRMDFLEQFLRKHARMQKLLLKQA